MNLNRAKNKKINKYAPCLKVFAKIEIITTPFVDPIIHSKKSLNKIKSSKYLQAKQYIK